MNEKKHIIFDWNGTLVDDAWIFVDILNVLLKSRNLKDITIEQYQNQFCFPIKSFYKQLGVDISNKSFAELEVQFVQEYKLRMYLPELFSDVKIVLEQLLKKNMQLSILSASNQTILNKLIKHYQLNNYFNAVCGVDNYGANGKIKMGHNLLQKAGINQNQTILIGDTDYDYTVAMELGIDCILMGRGHQSLNRLNHITDNVLCDLKEVNTFLANI